MIVFILCLVLLFITFRIAYLLSVKTKKSSSKNKCKSLIVIGSGGHTLEMLKHVKTLNPALYTPRLYVMADSDMSSEYKINEVESVLQTTSKTEYKIEKIPRSREVNQSYFTSVFSTFYSTLHSVPTVLKFKPDLILCNGPGTCIPICVIGFLMNVLLFCNITIVFVESVCRVKTLSLSGKILLYLADVVIVQWENLQKVYSKTVFLGRLI